MIEPAVDQPKKAAATNNRPLRVCLIGAGAIGRRFTELVQDRLARSVELVGIAGGSVGTSKDWWPSTARPLNRPADLADAEPDIVVEAASRNAVAEWGPEALRCARKFVVCSASALADDSLLEELVDTARQSGSQLVLPHGALGGLHALSAASLLPLDRVTHTIRKPPRAWKGTPAETALGLDGMSVEATFFEGSARDAAKSYPANANVVVLSALSGIGLDRTRVRLVADPVTRRNVHEVTAAGVFGELSFRIENEPMPSNPKTSDITALTIVRLLEAEVSPLIV